MTDVAMQHLFEQKVAEHDKDLLELRMLTKQIAESQKELVESMKSMSIAVNKIDLWLEKMANLDANTKDSFKRVYDVLESKYDKIEDKADKSDVIELQQQMKDLEVARFFSKYPKLLLAVIVGLCMLNIEPIRKLIFGV